MRQPHSFLLRDHYGYWASKAEDSFAGKVHLINRSNSAIHSIFFDDNVESSYAHIIDARDCQTGEKLPFEQSVNQWYAKAQPIIAIDDGNYYINSIAGCEQRITEFFAGKLK